MCTFGHRIMTANGPRVRVSYLLAPLGAMARYLHQVSCKYRDKGMHSTRVLGVVSGLVMLSIYRVSGQDKRGDF